MRAKIEGQVLGMKAGQTKNGKPYHEAELLQMGNGHGSEIVRVRFWSGVPPKIDVGKSAIFEVRVQAFSGQRGGAFLSADVF